MCNHHWIYESPGKEYSLGVCKLCGQRNYARNSMLVEKPSKYFGFKDNLKRPGDNNIEAILSGRWNR